jgi:hypothetical protein
MLAQLGTAAHRRCSKWVERVLDERLLRIEGGQVIPTSLRDALHKLVEHLAGVAGPGHRTLLW